LWPETVDALHVVLANRKEPSDDKHAGLIFITKYGGAWYRDGKPSGAITHEFRKLLDSLDIYRRGLSFYAIRHTFQTIGDETGDYLAVRRIMGHSDNSISDVYRERFPDERLQRVVDHVHTWLWGA
jgi:integrase